MPSLRLTMTYTEVSSICISFFSRIAGAKIWWEKVGVSLVESELRSLVNRKLKEREGQKQDTTEDLGVLWPKKLGRKKGQITRLDSFDDACFGPYGFAQDNGRLR